VNFQFITPIWFVWIRGDNRTRSRVKKKRSKKLEEEKKNDNDKKRKRKRQSIKGILVLRLKEQEWIVKKREILA
jgi:hypothetical protein